MDPEALLILAAGALGAIGLLRRGTAPVSDAGRKVSTAGLSAASPLIREAQRLPWPLRPVASTAVAVSTMIVTSQAALVVDGASTLVEAARRPTQQDTRAPSRPAESGPSARNARRTAPAQVAKTRRSSPTGGAAAKKAAPGRGRAATTRKSR
jgi:hypothetical protein